MLETLAIPVIAGVAVAFANHRLNRRSLVQQELQTKLIAAQNELIRVQTEVLKKDVIIPKG